MRRIVPKPPIHTPGPIIQGHIPPEQLATDITPTQELCVLIHTAIPQLADIHWVLSIGGAVRDPTRLTLNDLKRHSRRTITTIHQCCGSPLAPTEPTRRIANVTWSGVGLADVLAEVGVAADAAYLWAYGIDYGEFAGHDIEHYVKDIPLRRIATDTVLIADELNGEPLLPQHGAPIRLIVPGFYATNSVKWLCHLEIATQRAPGPFTTEFYNDTHKDGSTTPVWDIAPEAVFVAPIAGAQLRCQQQRLWGRAWGDQEIQSVEISTDGGHYWHPASVSSRDNRTPDRERAWQTFEWDWHPSSPGEYALCVRATDSTNRCQPSSGARNSIQKIKVTVLP